MKDVVRSWLKDAKLDSLDELAQRFGLDELARGVLALTWAVERSLETARRAREAAGAAARGLTVEVVRDALGQPVDAVLASGAPLRRYALITVDVAGPALATSELRLGAGVGPRLEGTPLPLDEFAPGVRLIADGEAQFPASAKIAELAKDKLIAKGPLLATVDGCPRKEALALGAAAAKRLSRGLLAVDGEVLAGLAGRWELLSALRREADLEGLVLVVAQAAALGEAWRALAVAPPALEKRPVLIVLADAARTREVTLVDGLRHLPLALGTEKPSEARVEVKVEAKPEDPYELIRKQAQRDAEVALGIWRGQPAPPPPKVEAAPAKVEVAPPKVEAPAPPKVEAAPPKVEAAPPKVEAAPPKVEAAPEEKPKKKRSKKNTPPAVEAAPPKVEAAPDPDALSADAPYMPVPEKPTPDMLALIARTAKNPKQRLELLEELKNLKIPSVVQAMRENARSADAKIKALAEATLANFFGPNWNRTRAIAKPVQPPASDDKNPNRPW
jgi:hypothetical protein